MQPQIKRHDLPRHLVHTCIVASDFERSYAFYTNVLGAAPVAEPFDLGLGPTLATFLGFDGDDACRVVFLRWGDDATFVELQTYREAGAHLERSTKDIGLARIALQVDDRDAAWQRLSELGVDVGERVEFTLPNGKVRRAFSVRDPDGNLVELIEYLEASSGESDLAAKVEVLHAERLIRNRYAAYCFAADDRDPVAMAQCFTPDAVVEVVGRPPLVGRDQIAAVQRTPATNRHHVLNLAVHGVDGDRAQATAYFLVLAHDGEPIGHGRYVDVLQRSVDGWQFARRRIEYVWQRDDYKRLVAQLTATGDSEESCGDT